MFRRIIVPLDGSALSEAILPEVERLAADSPVELVLLAVGAIPHEVQNRAGTVAYLDDIAREEADDLAQYLEGHAHRLQTGRVHARTRVRFGEPAAEIVRCADEEEADAIAMSTHGRTGLDRLVHGSVAGTVRRSSRLPVLLLRPDETAFAQTSQAPRQAEARG
jgi:nucleotide-binding universal stress UspA family protein